MDGPKTPNIDTLPDELLTEVFTFALDEKDKWNVPPTDGTELPWIVARVSSRWRSVALSQPSLWSTISVLLTRSPHTLSIVQECLRRSRSYPLDINFEFENWSSPADPFISLFVAECMRWRSFHFDYYQPIDPDPQPKLPVTTFEEYLAPVHGRLPLLEALSVRSQSFNAQTTFSIAPRLSSIRLGQPAPKCEKLKQSFPLHQLTTFHYFGGPSVCDILRSMPRLRKCEATFPATGNGILTHGQLLTLRCHCPSLKGLNLPSLRHLDTVIVDDIEFTDFLPFLRQAPHLETLRLERVFPGEHIPDFFAALKDNTTIVSLDIANAFYEPSSTAFIHEFMRADDPPGTFLPCLARLRLAVGDDVEECIELIEKRTKGGLKNIIIRRDSGFSLTDELEKRISVLPVDVEGPWW